MEKILVRYSKFRYMEDDYNNITWYKDNINSYINVKIYYLLNEVNPRAITVLELKAKIS